MVALKEFKMNIMEEVIHIMSSLPQGEGGGAPGAEPVLLPDVQQPRNMESHRKMMHTLISTETETFRVINMELMRIKFKNGLRFLRLSLPAEESVAMAVTCVCYFYLVDAHCVCLSITLSFVRFWIGFLGLLIRFCFQLDRVISVPFRSFPNQVTSSVFHIK